MKIQELAVAFANGATKGKASHMFIEGNTIFSYGSHFPIAYRLSDNRFLFNEDKYSQSTSRHVNAVMNSLNGQLIFMDTETIVFIVNKILEEGVTVNIPILAALNV